jgi:WD40 repeat protein
MRVLPGPTKANQVLAWSPDGRWLAAGGSGVGATVWDVDANAPGRRVLESGHGSRLLRFCPATGRLLVAFQTGGFAHWVPSTDEERYHNWGGPHAGLYLSFHAMAVTTDGNLVAANLYREWPRNTSTTCTVGYAVGADGATGEVWSRIDREWASGHTFTFRPGTDELFGLWTAAYGPGKPGFAWVKAQSGERVGRLPVPRLPVAHWALSPAGEQVAWITDEGLFVRGLEGDSEGLHRPNPGGEHRRGLAWSPDGRLLSYTAGMTVRLLDSGTLDEVRALDWNIGKPRAVAFNPDGLRAAVSGDGGRGWVTVFDLE